MNQSIGLRLPLPNYRYMYLRCTLGTCTLLRTRTYNGLEDHVRVRVYSCVLYRCATFATQVAILIPT